MARSSFPVVGRGSRSGDVGADGVQPRRPGQRALVDRALVGHGPGRDVDDRLAVPEHLQAPGRRDLAEDGGLDVPLRRDLQEGLEVAGADDRHHPLLRLAHEDLLGPKARVPERHALEVDHHAAVAVAGELAGRAGQSRAAEVLDAVDHVRGEQLQAALDEDLLRERVADLHRRTLRRALQIGGLVEGLRGQHRDAADAVAAGARAEEDDEVPLAPRVGQVDLARASARRRRARSPGDCPGRPGRRRPHRRCWAGPGSCRSRRRRRRPRARRAGCRGGSGRRTGGSP